MTIGIIECFAGISGDMLLGALVSAGVPVELLQDAAASLGIGAELRVQSVDRNSVRAIKVDVLEHGRLAEDDGHLHAHGHDDARADRRHGQSGHENAHQPSRNWPQIRGLIEGAAITEPAKKVALRAFELLAEAEAKVHGIALEKVHFHEVGAVDTIIDIVCAAVGAAALGVTEWRCSAVNVGSGFVDCAHGRLPVPAPATAELLKGVPVYSAGPQMELTTPTGAALLRALGCRFDASERLVVIESGYGAGSRNPEGFANVLRLSTASPAALPEKGVFAGDRVVVLECAMDDATPQVLAHAMELALEHGALDAMAGPVTMKKGRLGTLLTLLCRPPDEEALEKLLFRETTTLGIRRREEERVVLEREFVTVETQYGNIRMKIASAAGEVLNAMPEYEDCRRAAREHDVPLRAAIDAARTVWTEGQTAKAKA